MKKLLCLILALIMVMSLCACSQEKPNNENNTGNQNNQGNTEQNDGEPSDNESDMMRRYSNLANKLKTYATNGSVSYHNGEVSMEGPEALEAIYKDLLDMEELDKWYGTEWIPADDPETNWNRQELLSGFSVLENKLLKQNGVLTDRVGETTEYNSCFTWSYSADGKIESVRWNAKLFDNFIPYVFGMETEAFYDVVQQKGNEPNGMKLVYNEQGALSEIKITGEVENSQSDIEFQFTLKYDENNKLVGADWAKYSEYFGNIKFEYDVAGNLTQAVSEIWNDDKVDDTYTYNYSYDTEGNLKEVKHSAEGAKHYKADAVVYTFAKKSATETSGTVSIYGGAWRYYNKDNQKDQINRDVTLTYDAQGRLVKVDQGEGGLYNNSSWYPDPYNKAVFEYVYGDVYTYVPAK